MKVKKFNNKEKEELSRNKNVKKCGESSITYTEEFKMEAMRQYEQGLTASQIFKNAGFDLEIIGKKRPRDCITDWRKMLKKGGVKELKEDKRGGCKKKKIRNKKHKDKTTEDKMKRLEAEVAYLKEENAFLAQLRAEEEEN